MPVQTSRFENLQFELIEDNDTSCLPTEKYYRAIGKGETARSAMCSLSEMDRVRFVMISSVQENFDTSRGHYYVVIQYKTSQFGGGERRHKSKFFGSLIMHVTAGGKITHCGRNGKEGNTEIAVEDDVFRTQRRHGSSQANEFHGNAHSYPPLAKALAMLEQRAILELNIRNLVAKCDLNDNDPLEITPPDWRFRQLVGTAKVSNANNVVALRDDIDVAGAKSLSNSSGYSLYEMSKQKAGTFVENF